MSARVTVRTTQHHHIRLTAQSALRLNRALAYAETHLSSGPITRSGVEALTIIKELRPQLP